MRFFIKNWKVGQIRRRLLYAWLPVRINKSNKYPTPYFVWLEWYWKEERYNPKTHFVPAGYFKTTWDFIQNSEWL